MKLYDVNFENGAKFDADVKVRAENMFQALEKVIRRFPDREVKGIYRAADEPEVLE